MKKLTLFFMLCMALLVPSLQAKNIYLSSTGTDTNTGELAAPVGTIAKAMELAESGDSILVMDIITITSRFEFTGIVYGGKTIGFRGLTSLSGFTGNNTSTLFKFTNQNAGQFSFKNLIFKDSYSENTGDQSQAIYIQTSNPKFINCTFSHNCAVANANTQGGAFRVLNYDYNYFVEFENCTFSNNEAKFGGAINLQSGDLRFNNCDFINNIPPVAATSGSQGGAIQIQQGDRVSLTMTNCSFSGNKANDKGAAICLKNGVSSSQAEAKRYVNINIDNCVFKNNEVTAGSLIGGAIFMEDGTGSFGTGYYASASINITNSTFTENKIASGNGYGGAICINKWNTAYNNTAFNIIGCTFTGNDCKYGAAFAFGEHGKSRIKNCTFQQNTYSGSGDAEGNSIFANLKNSMKLDIENSIFNENGGLLTKKGTITIKNGNTTTKFLDLNILSCAFIGNHQGESVATGGHGAALYINDNQGTDGTGTYSSANISIINSTFYHNKSGYGSAICFDNWYTTPANTLLKIINSTFANNFGQNGVIIFDKKNSANMPKQLYNLVIEGNRDYLEADASIGLCFKNDVANQYANTEMKNCFINIVSNVDDAVNTFSDNTLNYGNNTALYALSASDTWDSYISAYKCIPVTQSTAFEYGNATYLSTITTDQLGYTRPKTNNKVTPGAIEMFPIVFEANGGTPAPETQILFGGQKIVEPTSPSKDDNDFAGWYSNNEFSGDMWGFNTNLVSAPVTLYAKWTSLSTELKPIINDKVIRSVEFYDFTGKKIHADSKGLVIKKTIFEDGTSTTTKIDIKNY